jgi:hypothetical protein
MPHHDVGAVDTTSTSTSTHDDTPPATRTTTAAHAVVAVTTSPTPVGPPNQNVARRLVLWCVLGVAFGIGVGAFYVHGSVGKDCWFKIKHRGALRLHRRLEQQVNNDEEDETYAVSSSSDASDLELLDLERDRLRQHQPRPPLQYQHLDGNNVRTSVIFNAYGPDAAHTLDGRAEGTATQANTDECNNSLGLNLIRTTVLDKVDIRSNI